MKRLSLSIMLIFSLVFSLNYGASSKSVLTTNNRSITNKETTINIVSNKTCKEIPIKINNNSITNRAIARVAEQDAIERAARIKMMEEQIIKEDTEMVKAIIAIVGYLIYGSFKLTTNGIKLLAETLSTNTELALQSKNFNAIRGYLGLAAAISASMIIYQQYKECGNQSSHTDSNLNAFMPIAR